MSVFYRFNSQFKIKDTELPPSARNTATKNALYAAVYEEFLGANENPKYKHLTPVDKIKKLNEFALNWLETKGFK